MLYRVASLCLMALALFLFLGAQVPAAQDKEANTHEGTVVPINTTTNTPGTPIRVVGGPNAPTIADNFGKIAITPDGKTAYVTTGSTVTPINTATNKPGTPIHFAGPARGPGIGAQIVITPDGKTAYVVTGPSLTLINTATNTPGKPIHVAGTPYGGVIAITP